MLKRPLIACAVATLVMSCRTPSGPTITLGAAGPWTEEYGAMNRRGIELAVEELNARARDRHEPLIRVVFRDDGGDGMRAAAIAQEFVNRADIAAVVGHVNSGAMVAAARVYDGHLAAVATTASTPALTGISGWTFRVISSDSINGLEIARFVMRHGRRRAAILYENNAYGRGLTDAFMRGFKGEILSADPISEGSQDFEPFVTYFKARNPEVVFVAGTGGSGLAFLREARRQQLRADLVGGDGWSVLAADTALAEGVYVGAPFTADDRGPDARAFVARFRKRYGMTPDGNAALAYDATMLVAATVRQAGTDRRRVRQLLAELAGRGGFRGVTGAIAFSPDGDPLGKAIVMTRIHRGALTLEDGQ
jgi:branched-chain amino acid transport system substrate-binding protein